MKTQNIICAALCALALCSTGCKKTLADAAAKRGVDFGFAASTGDILTESVQKILAAESKILVAENCMKSSLLRPNKTFCNWSDPESLVKFAEKNKITAKWHTLFWHEMNPPFINQMKSREEAQAIMDDHIATVMRKFKGRIRDYDVVNEMFNEDGS
ncbi:MAG: endo-1,4-beta-xylanase, partial [Treponema sp.]|nr:endo-1,4-beta-xylanase [Treponema sp.]